MCGTIGDYVEPYRTITGPYRAIWDCIRPYRTKWDLTGAYESIQDHTGQYETIWDQMSPLGDQTRLKSKVFTLEKR